MLTIMMTSALLPRPTEESRESTPKAAMFQYPFIFAMSSVVSSVFSTFFTSKTGRCILEYCFRR